MDQNKKSELAGWLVMNKGLLNPADQEAEIAKMAQQCPEATAVEKGLKDDVDKAYEVLQIMQGNNGGVSPTETQSAPATKPTSSISAAEEMQISKTLLQQNQERTSVSANSSIENLILDRPAPDEYIEAGTVGMIVEKGWKGLMEKIENGTYTVLPDDGENIDAAKRIASTTNFNALKAAFDSSKAVKVYIGKLNTKPIGYFVNMGTAVGSSQQPVQKTREQLEQFLVMDTAGYILASETKPGAKLRYVKGKTDPSNPGKTMPGKTILADANKKAAIESGSYVVSREKSSEIVSTSCKSDLQFRVKIKDKFLQDGVTPKTRTIRVSLKTNLPVLVRKPEYVDVFGTGGRDNNGDLLEVPTGDQAKKINEAQRNAIAQLRQKANDPTMLSDLVDIQDKLAKFDAPAAQAPEGIAIN